jgi:hypothetical protein
MEAMNLEPVRIADLGWIVHPGPGERIIALLKACFDGSWSGKPPGITSVAGYVAPLAEWEKVEAEWRRGLADWGIPRFRASGLDKRMSRDKAELCTLSFERIIENSQLHAIGAALLDTDWHQPDWGEHSIPKLSSPYEQCLDLAFKVLGTYTRDVFASERVAVFCCMDTAERKIEEVFARKKQEYSNLLNVTIGSGKDIMPLQCADLAASRLRQSWRAIASDEAPNLSWGVMPRGKGTRGRHSFLSLRQAGVLFRALEIEWKKRQRTE